uniref:Reverse transcriptase domain-containing protein n=1 Tax=Nippostrongylus brasiliensis TaxID=27835 RepID=A0A0N4Y8C1_NIPBR
MMVRLVVFASTENYPKHFLFDLESGYVLSPLLFNAVIDVVMKKALVNQRGVLFGDGQRTTDLTFADDVAVFANNEEELTQMLREIATTAYPYGLIINAKKTKVLTSDGTPDAVFLDNKQLEHANSFKYLSSLIQGKIVASALDVQNRIGVATAAFESLSWCLWRKPNVSTQIKMRIYRVLVLPILLYGSEVWTLLQRDELRLETFQMKCLRRILGVTLRDRLRNEFVRKNCDEQSTIAQQIRKGRLRWFGHVCRMDPTRIPYRVLWRKRLSSWKCLRTAPKKTWLKKLRTIF